MIRMTGGCYRRLYDDMTGVCTVCHQLADDVEPDAMNYKCQSCGMPAVMGLEQALLLDDLEIVDEGLQNVDDAGPAPRAKLISVGWKGRKT